mmetsp:Transcript_5171/g.11329  ORF Transcript_5171/g.11329 Transcript_5171/m.11329 type:complete len:207 (-) Transcript_5171:1165-1785(-)
MLRTTFIKRGSPVCMARCRKRGNRCSCAMLSALLSISVKLMASATSSRGTLLCVDCSTLSPMSPTCSVSANTLLPRSVQLSWYSRRKTNSLNLFRDSRLIKRGMIPWSTRASSASVSKLKLSRRRSTTPSRLSFSDAMNLTRRGTTSFSSMSATFSLNMLSFFKNMHASTSSSSSDRSSMSTRYGTIFLFFILRSMLTSSAKFNRR